MNCDEAFDRMTVLGAGADEPLQWHLSHCRRCRAMQETLSPAMEWLSNTQTPVEGLYSAGDCQPVFLTEEAVQVAERAAQRLAPVSPAVRRRTRWWRFAARWTAVASLACFGLFAVISPPRQASRSDSAQEMSPLAAVSCRWMQREHGMPQESQTAEQVITSCVACHFTLR